MEASRWYASNMTAQEIFDVVSDHLRKQGRAATQGQTIAGTPAGVYRAKNGDKSAAGCLLSDEEYRTEFEGILAAALPPFRTAKFLPHVRLICDLEQIHDTHLTCSVEAWEKSMVQMAKKYNLIYTPPLPTASRDVPL